MTEILKGLFHLITALCSLIVLLIYFRGVRCWLSQQGLILSKEDGRRLSELNLKATMKAGTAEEFLRPDPQKFLSKEELEEYSVLGRKCANINRQSSEGVLIFYYVLFTIALISTYYWGARQLFKIVERLSGTGGEW